MELGLEDKVALVTGASGTIGQEIATAFGREGAAVAVGYFANPDQAQSTVDSVVAAGGRAFPVRVDLANAESMIGVVDEVEAELGPLSILVNNGVSWPARGDPGELFEDVPLDRIRESVEANLVGQYALSQAAVRSMRSGGWGRITHISTGLVDDGLAGSGPYVTPKAGLQGLTRTMSRELAGAGIYTNVVMSGFVPHGDVPPAVLEQVRLAAATGRTTQAWEVANLVVFLSSAANGHITGEKIRADGHFLTRT